jgi:hypothetical protein
MEMEQEVKGASETDLSTRAELVEYTLHVETAGTLDSLVEAGTYSDAQKLIVTGNIAYKDVNYVDVNMPTVEVLDLARSKYESESIEGVFLSDSTKIKEISLPGNITSISGGYGYDDNSQSYLYFYPFECSSLNKITLPNSVTNIRENAFHFCSSLTSINIPEGVTNIGESAFCHCSSLISITLPKGVTSIGDDAFYDCSSLTSINIPEGMTSIGSGAFYDCSSLTSINIPKGVTSIVDHAFHGCSSLTSINIPEGMTSIGSWAFVGCSSLTSIYIPEGVTNIGVYAFYDCSSLISITLPKGVTSIESCAFYGCSSLTSINIPEGVTKIEEATFVNCSALTSITIQESVTSIGEEAFYGCSSLTNINIPKNVTKIEYMAFCECSALTSITIPESVTSIGSCAFYGCSSLTNINIPESVTDIGSWAFYRCGSLTNINIPESVTSFGEGALQGCSSLQKVICHSSVNDIGDIGSSNNLYCWLIINSPDGKLPIYGTNWQNVVINGVAENVILPYQKSVDFTIPEEVKSIKRISYTMTFDTNNTSASYGIWRTIALPFTPTHITHAEKGTLAPFDSDVDGALNFWLREWTTEGLKDVTLIEPNHPYLIAMPNSQEYADKYNISGDVTFSAENLKAEDFVNSNTSPLSAEGSDYTMYASYSYMSSTDSVYVLDSYNQFRSNYRSVYPFEAYLKANTSTLRSVISLNTGRAATRTEGDGKREPQIDDM